MHTTTCNGERIHGDVVDVYYRLYGDAAWRNRPIRRLRALSCFSWGLVNAWGVARIAHGIDSTRYDIPGRVFFSPACAIGGVAGGRQFLSDMITFSIEVAVPVANNPPLPAPSPPARPRGGRAGGLFSTSFGSICL